MSDKLLRKKKEKRKEKKKIFWFDTIIFVIRYSNQDQIFELTVWVFNSESQWIACLLENNCQKKILISINDASNDIIWKNLLK